VGIIVGGAGKMGQQFATTLGYAGATIIIADVNRKKCNILAEEISLQTKSSVSGFECNITDEKQIQKLFHEVYEKYKRIDFLIYNVMTKPDGYYKSNDEYTTKTWNEVLSGNLTGAFLCCREVAKYMKSTKRGTIVLTSSTYAIVGPDQSIYRDCSPAKNIYGDSDPLNCPASYSASKAGLIGLVRYFATLWGDINIRVNVLIPGGVYDGQEEPFHEKYIKRTPLGRMGVWSDYKGAILFLVSDASRYMTGALLVVDGGWTAW
jgi:NAD(P)-dependent dehydrogenase (short-subunit alcohol dehydrogenase family)